MEHDFSKTIIYRNPNLINVCINEDFYSIVNPFIDHGLKVLNKEQVRILDSIPRSGETIKSIIRRTAQSENDIIALVEILKERSFVSETDSFPFPSWEGKSHTLNLWVQTTNDCNLRCSYCYIHTLGHGDFLSEEMIDTFIKKVVETVVIHRLRLVQLRLAGGEPLLKYQLWKKYLPQLRKELEKVNCSLKVAFLSNLVALSDDIIQFMKDNSVGIGVSMDGLNEFQDATRHFANGNGSYKIVRKNIKVLQENGFKPSIMTVVSNSNLDGLENFTKFVIETNLHTRYSFVSGEDIDINRLIDKLHRCYDIFEEAINKGYNFSRLHQLCDLKFDKLFFQTCTDGYNGGALFTNGDIFFCQRHFGMEKPLGSITESTDILSIIHRKTYYNEVSTECNACSYRFMCTSGCPIERVNGKDPHCAIYKEIIPRIFKLRGLEHIYKYKVEHGIIE